MQLTININVTFTDNDIDEIMCTALEGGICSWCGRAEVVGEYLGEYASDQISRKGTLLLHDIEDDNDVFELTYDKFVAGLKKYLETCTAPLPFIEEDTRLLDASMIDAEDADAIIQYALFGEIVYG